MSESKHLFVAGPQRSGTTLLQLILSAHPLITVTPEAQFICQLFSLKLPLKFPLKQTGKDTIIALMRNDDKLKTWPNFNLEEFMATVSWETINQLLDLLFRFFAEQNHGGIDYLGNKKGFYTNERMGQKIKDIFPDAKFIYIVRDPRDIIHSMQKNFPPRLLSKAANICQIRGIQMQKMRKNFPDDVLIIRYEDLIINPETLCSQICDFLGVLFDGQMLNFYKLNTDGSRLIGVTKDIHPNTMTPFNPDLIGQWEKTNCFNSEELQTIETITRDYMNQYGYQ
jgi:hypothetical protein